MDGKREVGPRPHPHGPVGVQPDGARFTRGPREDLCAAVLGALEDGVLALDAAGAIVELNGAAERILGRPRAALLGKPLLQLLAPDRAWPPPFETARVSRGMRVEVETGGPNGAPRTLEVSLAPIEGQPPLLGAVLREITARKRAESELQAAKEAAEAASAAKTRFLASISHDLRTPMAAILGYADLLGREDAGSAHERGEWLEQIRRNADHLLALLNDILDLSKIEAGEVALEVTRVNLFQALADAESLMAPLAHEKLLDLRVEWGGPLPEWIETDPVRLRQILVNLVSNAIKFTDQGEVALRVEQAPSPPGRARLRISVADTGSGIPPEDLERIFAPFTPLAGRKAAGTGLGLNISRRLARLLGGDLTVRSTPGRGSTFSLELDAGAERAVDLVDTTRIDLRELRRRRPTRRIDLSGVRILVVDDNRANRRLLVYMLEEPGALVSEAADGQEAVGAVLRAQTEGAPFDLVLMDMQMPVLDGYEATRTLRQLGVRTPVVALTAHAMTGDRDRCLAAGCDAYVAKPLVREQFLGELSRLLRRSLVDGQRPQGGLVSIRAGDPGFQELLREYAAELPGLAEQLVEAHRAGELPRLTDLCHQLAGSGGSYGFPQISSAARRCEQVLRQGGGVSDVADPLAELCALLRSVTV